MRPGDPPPDRRVPRAVVVLALLVAALLGCRLPHARVAPTHAVVLVSLDGFRSDYFDRYAAPNLHRLAARGVRSERLIPSFPSKTFPNHFTLVTGRWPAHHGIVANDMFDPWTNERFAMSDRQAVTDAQWWRAEPIWVTAERAGIRTAPVFWPGSEAAIGGVRPTYSEPFDDERPDAARVRAVLDLLARPVGERPGFLTLYFSDVDTAGHESGPGSADVGAAVARVDRAIGRLLVGLGRLGLGASTDVVVVSDHGMAAAPTEQVIYLEDFVDVEGANVITWSPVLELWPPPEQIEGVLAKLRGPAHLEAYRREELPAAFHYAGSERIPPIVAIADEGWSVTTRARQAEWRERERREGRDRRGRRVGGEHGYDPALPSMGALFIAAGPSFARGRTVGPFENVEVYPLLCAALGITPVAGDWTAEALPDVLSSSLSSRSR